MNTKSKIERIVARNPELKETFKSLESEENKKKLHKIVEEKRNKIIIIGVDSEREVRLYELSAIINSGYIHITNTTTVELLDNYVDEEEPSLSSVTDDLVIIKDSRAYVPNKQKSNMVMQVLEQNDRCIYYYKGTQRAFASEHPQLIEYARTYSIPILTIGTRKVETGDII